VIIKSHRYAKALYSASEVTTLWRYTNLLIIIIIIITGIPEISQYRDRVILHQAKWLRSESWTEVQKKATLFLQIIDRQTDGRTDATD